MKKPIQTRAIPVIPYDPRAILTPEEKAQLRTFVDGELYQKLLKVVAGMRPSSNCALAGSTQRDQFSDGRAVARLSEMRGWDLYHIAIFSALDEKPLPKGLIEETYPDEVLAGIVKKK